MPARSKDKNDGADRRPATEDEAGEVRAAPVPPASAADAAPGDAGSSGAGRGSGRRGKKRGAQAANAAEGVVFAIYTHTEERERFRALAENLKVTHGELLTLLLDMTEDLLESGQLEVRFKTVTVRKTKPEYVLKVSRSATD
ncbi:MAG: hypothetical protein ACYC5O_19490 [Anaerolineae bacterium]